MTRKSIVALLTSRAFGIIGYSLLVGLTVVYVYSNYIRPSRYEKLNISCFAYRDINRNGVYDLADRPYAGLNVQLTRPQGGEVSVESNLSGFANFPMSRTGSSALIRRPGKYTIVVKPPQEWTVTSGNAVQTVVFRALDDSPSGLAAEHTIVPVGVAPALSISGEIGNASAVQASASMRLRAFSAKGETVEIPVSPSGHFSFRATPGEWRIDGAAAGGDVITRTVVVKSCPVVLSRFAPGSIAAPETRGRAQTADFDHLTTSDTLYEIPNGYAGLNWTNWIATHQKLNVSSGYVNGAVSSEYVAYNSSGHPASVWSPRPFDFIGVHITAAWPGTEKTRVVIKAWRESELVHEDRIKVHTAGPIFFAASYASITRVEFSTETYWQIALDDFVFRTD